MESTIKALLAKAWKDEDLDLATGRHYFDEDGHRQGDRQRRETR